VTVLRSGSATDVGRVRKVNQDLPLETANLYAVADGMGGHVGGEVAAQVAVDALLRVFSRAPTRAGLEEAFSMANRAVWDESQERTELRGMGTTLTAAALVTGADGRDALALANVGDSRAYLYSNGGIVQVTADHSLAEERMRHGEMTEEEAAVHPQRHILTRALGVASDVETDMWELQLRSGDRLILCSDGLSNEISREEMVEVLATVRDPGDAAHRLVDIANEHGGSDNITVIVVDVLVGEDTPKSASVITPIGARAGVPLLVPHGSAPGPTSAPAPSGALAEGSQLGFGGRTNALSEDGPRSGEFFLDSTQAVPLARATDRSAVSQPSAAPVPLNETRRQRRRRLGIPRRITVRVVLFVLLVAAVPTAAYFAIRWYAYDNWYLSIQKQQIVVQQGHKGGVLWFQPKVVDRTGTLTSQLLATDVAQIRAGVQESSLRAAKKYIANLRNEYESAQAGENAATTTTTSTTVPGATTPTSVPPSPTTSTPATTASTSAPAAATTGTATSSVAAAAAVSTATPITVTISMTPAVVPATVAP
jgi:PPM family protein phosphatase